MDDTVKHWLSAQKLRRLITQVLLYKIYLHPLDTYKKKFTNVHFESNIDNFMNKYHITNKYAREQHKCRTSLKTRCSKQTKLK